MKRFLKNTMTLPNIPLLIAAIEKMTGQAVKYAAGTDAKEFTVYECITISIKNDGYTYCKGDLDLDVTDIKSLLNMILIEAGIRKGFSHFKKQSMPLAHLHQMSLNHIYRLSSDEPNGVTAEMLYQNILFTDGAPNEVGELFNINSKFIKCVRAINRKAVVLNILHDVAFEMNNQQGQAA